MANDQRRVVFISASFLSKQYKTIPYHVIEPSILLFGGKRSWLFPTNREEMLEARSQPTKYLEFDEDFKSLILKKEEDNLCFWFRPENSYKKVSEFLEKISDPVGEENYLPLVLDEDWWRQDFDKTEAKHVSDVDQIVKNFKSGDFDYDAVMELIIQSNPTLLPTLYWASEAKEN